MSSGRILEGDRQSTPVVAAVVPSRPAWFRPQSSGTKPSKLVPPPLVIVDPPLPAPSPVVTSWSAKLAASVFRVGFGMGWLVSGLIHLSLLATLGLFAYQTHRSKPAEITGVFGVPGGDTVLDTEVSMNAGGSLAPLEFEAVGSTSIIDPAGVGGMSAQVLGDIAGSLGGNGRGDGGNGSGGLGSIAGNIPVPASAVTRGSFTVWTEPEDPQPGQRYDIVIQVKMSPSIKGYRLRDLTGQVTGTDGFDKPIRFKSTDRKAVHDGIVQLRIDIPGADKLVKDTIRIRSEILKEEQTIEIVF